jgi:hypothetical protein
MRKLTLRVLPLLGAAIITICLQPSRATPLNPMVSNVPTYSGGCPATIPFKGTVFGANGSIVTYAFVYYDPGKGKTITNPTRNVVISTGAHALVADTGSVTGTGTVWVQLAVISPHPLSSSKVTFPVTCKLTLAQKAATLHGTSTTILMAPSPTPTPITYSVLEFTIYTGSDDLRYDSGAEADINFANGGSQTCSLKPVAQGDSWNNNSSHTIPCTVGPRSLSVLRQSTITIKLDEAGWNYWVQYAMSPDNWNVQRTWVGAYQPGSGQQPKCVVDVSGNPLARLTMSAPTVTITNYPSQC